MGVYGGPEIPNDGLVLALDAGNPRNFNLTAVEVLVVAGGGGGGWDVGGGGGAGGVCYSISYPITPGSAISVTIGNGGAGANASTGAGRAGSGGRAGANGDNSVFGGAITAFGGGGGGGWSNVSGANGGSGGGQTPNSSDAAYSATQTGGEYYVGYGNPGGISARPANQTNQNNHSGGSGGGGSGGPGGGGINDGTWTLNSSLAGFGGPGLPFNISGTTKYYGGGGGSSSDNSIYSGIGGIGGGGGAEQSGEANTGGGGGSGGLPTNIGGTGGSGIIIVRYPGPQKAIGGTVTSVGGDTIHTFTTVGSTTFTPLVATNGSAVLGLSDLSGNRNFGTSATGVTYNSANGGALSFDGGDASHIQIVNTAGQLDFPGDFTVGLWIYPTQYHRTYQTMIDTYPGGATNGWIFTTMNNASQVISWYTEGSNWQPSGTSVTLNAWNYVVASRIGTTVKLYKNATEILSHSDSSNIRGGVCRIGKGLDEGNSYGNVFGKISNVQIYKGKGLTAAEIQQNYNATKGRYEKGGINNPFSSPTEARILGYTSGDYYFNSGSMSSPQLLEFQRDYYENRGWVCVFRSPYASTATTNKIDLSIPMGGLLVQRDALDLRAAVYWSTPITYTTVGGSGNNTADSGYSPRRVILGGSGGHGIYRTDQDQCSWGNSTGAIGAGWDGGTCGSFPNGLIWGTGTASPTYENRSGIWSHWITWS